LNLPWEILGERVAIAGKEGERVRTKDSNARRKKSLRER